MVNIMLDEIFIKLDLKEIHSKIYLNLLEFGPSTVGKLSRKLNIPRSTLYGLLEDLNQKGFVLLTEKYSVKLWQASLPSRINDKINDKINDLKSVAEKAEAIVSNLKYKQGLDIVSPKFYFFEGREGIQEMLKDVLLYRDIETEAFWPFKDMDNVLGREFLVENIIVKRAKRNIYTKVIWPENKKINFKNNPFLGSGKEFKREIRLAPSEIDSSMGYWAYANKVAFISSKKENFGFLVESIELRKMIKNQFNVLWNISKPVEIEEKYYRDFVEKKLKFF